MLPCSACGLVLGLTLVACNAVPGNAPAPDPALAADIVAADSSRPYSLCGGMVAAVAHHPTRTDVHFDTQLLAARLGSRAAR